MPLGTYPFPMFNQLTSRQTLRQAFERVRDRAGCPGADGMSVHDFAADLETELGRLEDRLLRRRYRPFPLLRFTVRKRSGVGLRQLCVPTVRDRVAQTAALLVTQDLFEAEFEDSSYAFRRGRSVRSAIHRVRELRDQGYRFLVEADVDGFFDNLPHERLFARLGRLPLDPPIVDLFESWVRVEIYDGERVFPLSRGVPQGSVVSPMLANLFLDELDENLAELGQTAVRYADDVLVLAKSAESAAEALGRSPTSTDEFETSLFPWERWRPAGIGIPAVYRRPAGRQRSQGKIGLVCPDVAHGRRLELTKGLDLFAVRSPQESGWRWSRARSTGASVCRADRHLL